MNKILIIGATGGTGRELVKQALVKGYAVSVLVRNPAKADFGSGVTTLAGNVLDSERSSFQIPLKHEGDVTTD